jgi:hypothetical protein
VARLAAVFGGKGGQEQVAVALLAGGGRLGGPDGVQQGQVVGVGEGLLRVWVAGSCWPSWSRTVASTPSAVPGWAGPVSGAGTPARSAEFLSYRASSGGGLGPGTVSASLGDSVNTYA